MTPKIILSKTAQPELITYLGSLGYQVEPFGPIDNVQEPLRCHPDMLHCRLNRDTVFTGDPARLSPAYPGDIIYNACSTGKFFIHNLKYTAPELLGKVEELGLIRVNVSQGYAKCSTCVVGEDAIITYDRGIAKAAVAAGMDVLVIEPGHVDLPGYDTGFIGGASGLVTDLRTHGDHHGVSAQDLPAPDAAQPAPPAPSPQILVFNGDLSAHPDYRAITDFASEHGVGVKFFADWKLTDIGSII